MGFLAAVVAILIGNQSWASAASVVESGAGGWGDDELVKM